MKYKLPQTTKLGRSSSCDIQVSPKLTKVSRQHAEIKVYNGSMYVLYDQSSAGTLVNGRKQQQIVLHDGDRISLGGVVELQFFNGTLTSSSNQLRVTRAAAGTYGAPPAPAPIPSYDQPQKLPMPYNLSSQEEYLPPASVGSISTGHKISTSGAILAIIFFFMPWVITSCSGLSVEQSGWDMAVGSTVDYGLWGGGQQIPGKPAFFIMLIVAFLVLVLSYLAYRRGVMIPMLDGIAVIGLGVIPLVVLLLAFMGMQSEAAQYNVNVKFEFGLWAVVLGYVAVIVGGGLNLLESNASSRNISSHYQ